MQITKLPMCITKRIDQIQQNFVWGSTNEKRKLHLVKWAIVTKHKNERGLGLKNTDKNTALIATLDWRA